MTNPSDHQQAYPSRQLATKIAVGDLSEDQSRDEQETIQKETDHFIKDIEKKLKKCVYNKKKVLYLYIQIN